MTRVLRTPFSCTLLSWMLGFALPSHAAQPNIVLIVAEDLSARIGAFGDPVARTPNIDRLAREGVRFPNTFTTAGVCAPSRAALITGWHQISIGGQHMRTSTRPAGGYMAVPPPDVKAFPEQLRAAGYYTLVDQKLDYQFSGVLTGSGPFTIWDAQGLDETWQNRPEKTPFFAMFNLGETHESGIFQPLGSWPHSGLHLLMQLVRAWQYGLDDGEGATDPAAVPLPPYYPDTSTVRADLARHYNNVARMDAHVGEILARLEADGLAASTIVVFTTDHGDGLPRAKRELYDAGIRVPMIVRWPESLRPPGLGPGTLDDRLVSFVDLAPTFLEWAGAPVPAELPGRSLSSLRAEPRRYVYASRDRIDEVQDRQRALRDERFKYIRSFHPDQPGGHRLGFRDNIEMMRELWALKAAGQLDALQLRWFEPPGAERLFDIRADPHELHDLSRDPAYAAELSRMRAALDEWLAGLEDWSDRSEDEMVAGFQPEGEQLVTASPVLAVERSRIVATCATEGASIGYRVGDGPWRLYRAPIEATTGARVTAKAVRYGYSESEPVSLILP